MKTNLSLEQLKRLAEALDLGLQADIIICRAAEFDSEKFRTLIERAVNHCAYQMATTPKELSGLSEDQLSIHLVAQLVGLGIAATHDTMVGGHCDIVIREREHFLWLAEAKKIDAIDNNYLFGGYQQLLTRYSTGQPNQDHGSMVIFCNAPRMDEVLEKWMDYLVSSAKADITEHDVDGLRFRSSQIHDKTGRPYIVWHAPISVFFDPQDRSGRKRGSSA